MKAFDNSKFETYKAEAKERWGQTDAYKDYEEKTKNYGKDKWSSIAADMDVIMGEFALCMKNGSVPGSAESQSLVKKLQRHISENYYNCTNEILYGLGRMYIADERFKNNIDKHADGTAEFICEAIAVYSQKQ